MFRGKRNHSLAGFLKADVIQTGVHTRRSRGGAISVRHQQAYMCQLVVFRNETTHLDPSERNQPARWNRGTHGTIIRGIVGISQKTVISINKRSGEGSRSIGNAYLVGHCCPGGHIIGQRDGISWHAWQDNTP